MALNEYRPQPLRGPLAKRLAGSAAAETIPIVAR
jgi:hypothetical protein